MKRTSVQIRNSILKILMVHSELSLRQLERKVNTASQTIRSQIEDLKSLGFVKIKRYKAHPQNNKPYQTCMITQRGITYVKK